MSVIDTLHHSAHKTTVTWTEYNSIQLW